MVVIAVDTGHAVLMGGGMRLLSVVLGILLVGCVRDGDKDGLVGDEDCNDAIPEIGAPTDWYPDVDADGIGAIEGAVAQCEAPEGYVASTGDCADEDPTVRPGVNESCNGRDDDCDGEIDEEAPGALWYADADADGFGNPAQAQDVCVPGSGLVDNGLDCNDTAASAYPGGAEICDGLDNDCNGLDDDNAAGSASFWVDNDEDGWGTGAAVTACSAPSGYVDVDGDCDDAAFIVNPGAAETCNGVDDDCDGATDDDPTDGDTWYTDADGDTYGDDDAVLVTCSRPDDVASRGGDCDDADPEQNPETWWYADDDGDGWGDARTKAVQQCLGFPASSTLDGDCDDADADRYPEAPETCDGVDEDCDGVIDDGAGDSSAWYADVDADGFGNPDVVVYACEAPGAGFVAAAGDCDDDRDDTNPDASEVCDDVDNDCDLLVDDDDPSLGGIPVWYLDNDRDGYGTFSDQVETCDPPLGYVLDGSDCRDDDPAIHAYAVELCNGVDDDCDLRVDGADAIDSIEYFVDGDGDGWGDPATSTFSCAAPPGEVERGADCNDGDAAVHPLAPEACDAGRDLNCDGSFGFADLDGDGFVACEDCDDAQALTFPGAAEVCDDVDNDCNGDVDDDGAGGFPWRWYADADADAYGLSYDWVTWCAPGGPDGYASAPDDCDDGDGTVYPSAFELCDLRDNDCDGVIPAIEVDADFDGQTPTSCGGDDCDDGDPTVLFGGVEVCGDGIDNDCTAGDEPCVYRFSGILTDVDESVLNGWDQCYVGTYDLNVSLASIQSSCSRANLLVACRQVGSSVLKVAANAPRADVLFDTGMGNVLHVANDVGWYFNNSWSWGYANVADRVNRNSCDTETGSFPSQRLCFHTSGAALSGGYRCGTTTGLNSSRTWERVVYHADF